MFSKTDIEHYFNAEKNASLLLMALGAIAITIGIILSFSKQAALKGAAIPLLVGGVIMAIVGNSVYHRCDNDRQRNVYAFDMNPGALSQQELPRMEKVVERIRVYRWIECILAISAILAFLVLKQKVNVEYWKGLAATLALMAIVAITFDTLASKRAVAYLNGLQMMSSQKPTH